MQGIFEWAAEQLGLRKPGYTPEEIRYFESQLKRQAALFLSLRDPKEIRRFEEQFKHCWKGALHREMRYAPEEIRRSEELLLSLFHPETSAPTTPWPGTQAQLANHIVDLWKKKKIAAPSEREAVIQESPRYVLKKGGRLKAVNPKNCWDSYTAQFR